MLEKTKKLNSEKIGLCSHCVSVLNTVFKECPEGIVYRDEKLYIRTVNEAFCKIFNIDSVENLIGEKNPEFLSDKNMKIINDVNLEVQKYLRPINYVINLDGKKSPKILNITTTPIVKNKNFQGIVSIVKDITHEENIKEKFVIKHYQLKSLLENIPMIIYMQDVSMNYITGTKPSKIFIENGNDTFSGIRINPDEYKKEELVENDFVCKNNKMTVKKKAFKDQKRNTHWYKLYKVPINDLYGNTMGVMTLADNIDDETQLQSQRESFVASLGHDLKNPTIAQIRSLELLINGNFGNLNDEQKEILDMVLDSCRYMNGMLSSLLATYRNYDGVITLIFENFSFTELVDECISEMIYVAKDKDVKIHLLKDFDNIKIYADRIQIKRVIMNLLSNGIKYAYKESVLKILISNNNKTLSFQFENNSPYISEEKQKAIFAQYVSFASTHNEIGIGLGLFASKKIIEGHNGKIFVSSYKEGRNIFGFKIPLMQSQNGTETKIYF